LTKHLRFDAADLEQLNLNALEASFLPDGDKAELRQSFRSEFAALRARQPT
jgi:adenosine deaminase